MKILSVAGDQEVAEARENALKQAGFDVVSATDFKELGELCKQHTFVLAIVGHAFDPEVKRAIAAILGQCQPQPAILELYVDRPILQDAPAILRSLDLDDLVRRVKSMLREERARSA